MGKITRMTFAEAKEYVEKNNDKLQEMYDKAPAIDAGDPGEYIGRGWTALEEFVNKRNQTKTEELDDVSISIRIPRSYAMGLRATGRGWRNRVGEYLVKGIKRGDLGKI